MNNTKWRECISLLAAHSVYLQLRLVGEADFPLDYEASNSVLSHINDEDCVFVRTSIRYKAISAIRIAKTIFPDSLIPANFDRLASLRADLKRLGQLPLTEDDKFIVIEGY